jgi:cell division septation protein DedD
MPDPDPPEPEAEAPAQREEADESSEMEAIKDDVEGMSEEKSAPEPPPDPDQPSGSSLPRVLVSVLVFLLLSGGAWYILGQRGMVQSPGTTFAHVKATLQSGSMTSATQNSTSVVPEFSPSDDAASDTTTPATGSTPSPDSMATASAPSPEANTPAPDAADADNESAEANSRDTAATASSPEPPSATESSSTPSSRTISPADGGWSIVVASRKDPEAARSLADTYRDRFREQGIPTGIIEATVNNSTRYRVGVGQFSSQSDVQRFLDEHGEDLPDGAWSVRL